MQDDVRLDAAVKDGSFKKNPIFLQAIEHAKKNGTALHLLAYLTYKSSHGCIDYPLAICEMARDAGLDQVFFHIIFDGRSTEPGSAPKLLAELDEKLDFRLWFSGHYHLSKQCDPRHVILYDAIVQLTENGFQPQLPQEPDSLFTNI